MNDLKDDRYKFYGRDSERTLKDGIKEVLYVPWKHFDVIEVWAESPHPLKNVKLGYGFRRDIPTHGDKFIRASDSLSTDLTANAPKNGIKLTIMSYDVAVEMAKKIDWKKVKIER